MPAAQAPSRVGEVIGGKYELVQRLAVGGMGEVYRAMNLSALRPVALKLMRRDLGDNEAHARRFMREGRAANRARHPNILEVIDVDRDEQGNMYLVQELLEGEDLGRRLKRRGGKLPLGDAFDVLIPVAQAVGAAHAVGLVHRDIKPSNVFLSMSPAGIEVPKVLDFGIAKIIQADPEGNTPLTATDVALGTPGYMSPEQIKAPQTVDARSDVWALGVMIYRSIAGKLPFRASSPGALMVSICTEAPTPISKYLDDVPEPLTALLTCCLEKDPHDRFADGDAVSRALLSVAEEYAETVSASRIRAGSEPVKVSHNSMPSPEEWELEAPPLSEGSRSARAPRSMPSPADTTDWSLTPTEPPMFSERRPIIADPVSVRPATAVSSTRLRTPATDPPPPESPSLSVIAAGAVIGLIGLAFSWRVSRPGAFIEFRETLGSVGVGLLAASFGGAALVAWQRGDGGASRLAAAGLAAVSGCAFTAAWALAWGAGDFELVRSVTPWAVFAAITGLTLSGALRAKALIKENTGIAFALIVLALLTCYAALRLAL